jgi:hypothetical protein
VKSIVPYPKEYYQLSYEERNTYLKNMSLQVLRKEKCDYFDSLDLDTRWDFWRNIDKAIEDNKQQIIANEDCETRYRNSLIKSVIANFKIYAYSNWDFIEYLDDIKKEWKNELGEI